MICFKTCNKVIVTCIELHDCITYFKNFFYCVIVLHTTIITMIINYFLITIFTDAETVNMATTEQENQAGDRQISGDEAKDTVRSDDEDSTDETGNETESTEGMCSFCYLSPCCTSYDHDFVEQGQVACDDNPGIRKIRYRKYF